MLARPSRSVFLATLATLALLLAACASQPPVYSNLDRDADFNRFQTWAFHPQPATDKKDYSTLVTKYFKTAIRREMAALGYDYSENNPDLLVNFSLAVEDKSRVESSGPTFGFYSYRHGLYGTWPFYDRDVRTIEYKEGTAGIDLVDARRKQLVWEAVIEGRLSGKDLDNAEDTIARAVAAMFREHPLHRGQ